jgi:hypothetical protein
MNPYQYFSQASAGRNYEKCLDAVKAYADMHRIYHFQALYLSDAAQIWKWTIPGLYEQAIADSFVKRHAHIALENFIGPLEFSSTCGLPMAIKHSEVMKLREDIMSWIDAGFPIGQKIDSIYENEIKQIVFNSACNMELALRSIEESTRQEYQRISWLKADAYEMAIRPDTLAHLERVIQRQREVGGTICVHNILNDSTGPGDWCSICRG